MAISHRWKHSKSKEDGLPMALSGIVDYDVSQDQATSRDSDSGVARIVRHHIVTANKLVRSVAYGDLPSREYFKFNKNDRHELILNRN